MARRKDSKSAKVDLSAFDAAGARIIDNPLTTEVEDSYLEYAFSVIHSRALPAPATGSSRCTAASSGPCTSRATGRTAVTSRAPAWSVT